MAKIFYDQLIKFEEITQELGRFEMDSVEMEEIVSIADETIHIRILDVILTNLPKEKHKEFLKKFHQSPADEKLLDYLQSEIKDFEKLISDEAKKVKKEILNEIKKSGKK